MSMTRIAFDEVADKVSTSVATSAMTGMSGNLQRFKTRAGLNNVVVELERSGTSDFKIQGRVDMFWEKIGTRAAMIKRSQEYKEAGGIG